MSPDTGKITIVDEDFVKKAIAEAKGLDPDARMRERVFGHWLDDQKPGQRKGNATRQPIHTKATGGVDFQSMTPEQFMEAFMPGQVPLERLPDKRCKKCYGRGHRGRNAETGKFVPCSCTKR